MGESQRKQRSAANAVGGSTARACDGCLRWRARWYCGADDAFLCQACDASVHSANSLARRHQRLRLHTSSSSSPSCLTSDSDVARPPQVSWHRRKARTPRPKPAAAALPPKTDPLVPDMENNHHNDEEEDSELQLIFQVPMLPEFCPPLLEEAKPMLPPLPMEELSVYRKDSGSGPSMEMDLPELDYLLRAGLDDDESSLYIDGFTLVDQEDAGRIKMELDIDAMGEEVELFREEQGIVGFDGYQVGLTAVKEQKEGDGTGAARRMGLRLDYDAVINAWSQQGCSPWAGGGRPQFGPDGCLPSFMGMGEGRSGLGGRWSGSGGREEREARVTRYREKRRTRLFSKKIRYEVRKLNAEKRPRMKGRFVKRTTLTPVSGPTFPYQYNYLADH